MRAHILLQSATGNTRLVAKRAAQRLSTFGIECTIQDIARDQELPELTAIDLLGVACPVMYFRPAFAMTEFLDRLPKGAPDSAPPVFLLATAGGEPGAHFTMLKEQLSHKGYRVVGARWLPAPDSWPPLRRWFDPFEMLEGLARFWLKILGEPFYLRLAAGVVWPRATGPVAADLDALDGFVNHLAVSLTSGAPLYEASVPQGTPPFPFVGQYVTREEMSQYTSPRADARLCIRCGTCVKVCPSDCVSLDENAGRPTFGDGCTACWACYNNCPTRAISGWLAPFGVGQYSGPSETHRNLFRDL